MDIIRSSENKFKHGKTEKCCCCVFIVDAQKCI